MENRLTNDADYLLCILYEAYQQRRKDGKSIFDSKLFGDSENLFKIFLEPV